jgi:hypothetical protein
MTLALVQCNYLYSYKNHIKTKETILKFKEVT